jgi:hypothetical protein|tara:strand:+ start:329 stop:496 length:168 start_codon:yes stop_codon:yes gene_type:complete
MAKIVSDAVVIEISRIARDDESLATIVNEEMAATLQQVVEQLVGEGAVVEVKTTE